MERSVDCSNTNRDGPGRFRTEADNLEFQACYFNSDEDEQVYNEFVSEQIKDAADKNDFHFKIIELKSKADSKLTFDATEELRSLSRNDASVDRTIFSGSNRESSEKNDDRSRKRAKPGFLLQR